MNFRKFLKIMKRFAIVCFTIYVIICIGRIGWDVGRLLVLISTEDNDTATALQQSLDELPRTITLFLDGDEKIMKTCLSLGPGKEGTPADPDESLVLCVVGDGTVHVVHWKGKIKVYDLQQKEKTI